MTNMRSLVLSALLAPIAVAPMRAQEPESPPKPAAETQPAAGVDQWIEKLGDESFRARLQAERELRALGEDALPALRRAAENGDDHEVQWRARRLIRQIEGGERGLVRRSGRDDGSAAPAPRARRDGLEHDFDALFREFEQRFGLDIPRARFFHDEFFRDLQEQMRGMQGQSQGMTMQLGPDGAVRVEVEETDADGKTEKKVYEAPDMETFRSTYPGVLQRGGLGFDVRLWPQGRLPSPWDPSQRAAPSLPVPGFTPRTPTLDQRPSGPRLGVAVWPQLSPELREHLQLAEGVGLMVQSVEPSSLASSLALQPGDIVTRIGERTIGSPADVRSALEAIDVGDDVTVGFLRKGVERTATAPRPAQQDAARQDPARQHQAPEDGHGLRPRRGDDGSEER